MLLPLFPPDFYNLLQDITNNVPNLFSESIFLEMKYYEFVVLMIDCHCFKNSMMCISIVEVEASTVV